jgi:PDZ domain
MFLSVRSICKGPEWKPGIFVQFTKENGIARESGLRPGDQILSCNSIDFSDIPFSEAVSIMKNSSLLELLVRTNVWLDIFPGESSGYNSSASSITGDQSPCWGEASKRLSIVREESTNSNDQKNGRLFHERRNDESVDPSKVSLSLAKVSRNKIDQNTTIIKLSEDGPTMINNTMVSNSKSIANEKNEENTKHKKCNKNIVTGSENFVQNDIKVVPVDIQRMLTKIASPSQFANKLEHQKDTETPFSAPATTDQSSLNSAINEELRRRAEVKRNVFRFLFVSHFNFFLF